jgi:hypothetical protein
VDLDRQEQQALAGFFARRFPTDADRDALSRQAGLPALPRPSTSPVAAWESLIALAATKQRLGRLGRAAAATEPTDTNLAKAAQLLAAGEANPQKWLLVGLAVGLPALAVALVAVVAVVTGSLRPSAAVAAVDPTPATAAPVADNAVATVVDGSGPADVVEGPVAAVGASAVPSDVAPVGTAEEVEAPAVVEPPRPAHAPAVASSSSATPRRDRDTDPRCAGTPGQLIGYWFSGSHRPGGAGDVITMSTSMNVRAYHPSPENHFSLGGRVNCVLAAGDRIRLSADPVHVPRDSYWVPLYGGDLL